MTSVRVGMRHDGDSIAIVEGYALVVEAALPEIKGHDFFGEPEGFIHCWLVSNVRGQTRGKVFDSVDQGS